jgi:hypothetical protein
VRVQKAVRPAPAAGAPRDAPSTAAQERSAAATAGAVATPTASARSATTTSRSHARRGAAAPRRRATRCAEGGGPAPAPCRRARPAAARRAISVPVAPANALDAARTTAPIAAARDDDRTRNALAGAALLAIALAGSATLRHARRTAA